MDNFDLKKYLAENNLMKELTNFKKHLNELDESFTPFNMEKVNEDLLKLLMDQKLKGLNQLFVNLDKNKVYQHKVRIVDNKIVIEVFSKPRSTKKI